MPLSELELYLKLSIGWLLVFVTLPNGVIHLVKSGLLV